MYKESIGFLVCNFQHTEKKCLLTAFVQKSHSWGQNTALQIPQKQTTNFGNLILYFYYLDQSTVSINLHSSFYHPAPEL